jgi:hypothetical protein
MVSTKIVAGIVAVITFSVIVYLFVAFAAAPENTVRVIDDTKSITGSSAINLYETVKMECVEYCSEIEGYFDFEISELSNSYECSCLDYEGNKIISKEISK